MDLYLHRLIWFFLKPQPSLKQTPYEVFPEACYFKIEQNALDHRLFKNTKHTLVTKSKFSYFFYY